MTRRARSTGQGLVAHDVGAAVSRWLLYGRIVIAFVAAISLLVAFRQTTPAERHLTAAYLMAKGELWMADGEPSVSPLVALNTGSRVIKIPARMVVEDPGARRVYRAALGSALMGALLGAMMGVGISWGVATWMEVEGEDAVQDAPLRGSSLVSAKALARLTVKRGAGKGSIKIGSVPLPLDMECRHFALVGSTGSGKTTALRELLDGIERRGETALVYDSSTEFTEAYFDDSRGDIILSPWDLRGAFWSPFADIDHPADADHIAAQLVPSTAAGNEDSIWTQSARILVANILRTLWRQGDTNLESLVAAIQSATKEDLRSMLAGTSSARSFEGDADKATASVLFQLSLTASLLQYLRASPGEGGSFSFRSFYSGLDNWAGPKPWIFIPRREDKFEATKPLMACWLECAATAILGLEPSPTRRAWVICDEFPDLPPVQNLKRLMPQGRKFGAAVVLTFQAIGQMRDTYGKDGAEALLGCANTKLFLQLVDADSRKWASQCIGEAEVEVRGASESLTLEIGKGRTSLGSQRQTSPAILESEFRLPRFHGILQLPDAFPAARVVLDNRHILARGAPKQPGYVPGDISETLWGSLARNSADPAPSSEGLNTPILPEGGPV